MAALTVVVDRERCIGSGVCVVVAPATFSHDETAKAVVLNTAILVAFFAPFSYLVDSMTYRIWLKRAQGGKSR